MILKDAMKSNRKGNRRRDKSERGENPGTPGNIEGLYSKRHTGINL